MLHILLESSIFVHSISKFLYSEEIQNIYSSNKASRDLIDTNHNYIYTKVCLHNQPHGYTEDDSCQKWYKEGKLHRDRDLPAFICKKTGTQCWYNFGKLHRNYDKPAIIISEYLESNYDEDSLVIYKFHINALNDFVVDELEDEGKEYDNWISRLMAGYNELKVGKYWYKYGEQHRDWNQPAIVYDDGREDYIKNGKYHREGDLPACTDEYGDTYWYKFGQFHRDNDKATCVTKAGDYFWYNREGDIHRDNGLPARIYANGILEWWTDGVKIKTNDLQ